MTLSAAIAVASLAVSASGAAETLPFIADDFPQALATARAQSKPIFLEAWAPW
jgi:hypothetical protein